MATKSKDLFILRKMPLKQALGLREGKPDLAHVCSAMLRIGYAPAHFVPVYGPTGAQEAVMILGIMDPTLIQEIERQVSRASEPDTPSPPAPPVTDTAENLGEPEIIAKA